MRECTCELYLLSFLIIIIIIIITMNFHSFNKITGDTRYEAKIANFRESIENNLNWQTIQPYSTMILRWLAPEKMLNYYYSKPYTFKCEIFSFGMLLWELCAQKLPYCNMEA